MVKRFLFVFLSCFVASPAGAWQGQRAGAPYVGMGDLLPYTVYVGLRAVSNTVAIAGTQALVRIRNPTSGELCDVLPAKNGGLGLTSNCTSTGGGQTVSSFCGAADCKVQGLYDQISQTACTGSTTCNPVQNTAGNQPTITVSSGYTEIVNPGSTSISLQSATNYAPGAIGSLTVTAVGNKTGQFNQNIYAAQGAQNLINGVSSGANTWQLIGTTGPTVSATDGAWHTAAALLRGSGNAGICLTSSGCAFASTCLVSGTAGRVQLLSAGSASAVDKFREGGHAASHILTGSEANALNSNASAYWGFTPP